MITNQVRVLSWKEDLKAGMPSCCCLGARPNLQPSTLEVGNHNYDDEIGDDGNDDDEGGDRTHRHAAILAIFEDDDNVWNRTKMLSILMSGAVMDVNRGFASVQLWHRSLQGFPPSESCIAKVVIVIISNDVCYVVYYSGKVQQKKKRKETKTFNFWCWCHSHSFCPFN